MTKLNGPISPHDAEVIATVLEDLRHFVIPQCPVQLDEYAAAVRAMAREKAGSFQQWLVSTGQEGAPLYATELARAAWDASQGRVLGEAWAAGGEYE